MAVVSGVITFNPPGTPIIPNITVRVWDEDFRSKELLGEILLQGPFSVSASYRLEYSESQFQQNEAHTADLRVEASTVDGRLFGESDIVFNAREEERIDLVLQPVSPPERGLSELEQLQEALESLRQGVEPADFTLDRDISFLVEELVRNPRAPICLERMQLRQRLEFLRLADQLARTTQILLAAFYGWFRKDLPQVLEELLRIPTVQLRETLRIAVDERIIPNILDQLDEILEQLYAFQFETDRLTTHPFIGQLLNAETEQPLPNFRVQVVDLDAEAERQDLGEVVTETRGLFEISFVLPTDAPEGTGRNLRLIITNEDDREISDIVIVAQPNQQEVEQIRIQLDAEADRSAPIEAVAPPELAQILNRRNIRTLKDLLCNLSQTEDLDTPEMRRLRARAKLSAIVDDVNVQTAVLDRGYTGLLAIARDTRANFVGTLRESIGGDARAARLYIEALNYKQLLENTRASLALRLTTELVDDYRFIPEEVKQYYISSIQCGCQDCDSAVSPLAYLADLLSYILKNVKNGNANVTLPFLENTFHKPFRELPVSCEAVDKKVRQVRTCIAALRALLSASSDPGGFVQPTPQFDLTYRSYRNVTYQTLLERLGSSFEELRRLQPAEETFTQSELEDLERQSAAERLGIQVVNLVELFRDIHATPSEVTEANLEQIFGFKDTRNNPLEEPPSSLLQTWQLERLQSLWKQQDWIDDDYSNTLLPVVNPLLLTEAYFREPLAENQAFSLFQSRRDAVEAYRQQLIQADPQTNGLDSLIASELGQPIEQLQLWAEQLQSGEDAETAQQQVTSLHLTVASFTRLMAIATQVQQQGVEDIDDAVWQESFNILTRAHVVGTLYPAWIDEEENLALLFGPKLFWLPIDAADTPAIWLATLAEREQWEEALRRRSRPPLIDPNNLTPSNFRSDLPQGLTNPALSLWTERGDWLETILSAIQQARESKATALDSLQAALAASELGISTTILDELATALSQGQDLQPRLEQLSLTRPEYNFLTRIYELTGLNATIATSEWEQVDAILGQMRKRREYADWQQAEQQAEISLNSALFTLRPDDETPNESPQSQWLTDFQAAQQWADLLEARINQEQSVIQALQQAVSDTEEITLPLLRDALFLKTSVTENGLAAKAERLAKMLLTDTKAGGCQMTTWVSEAIKTLQLLLWGIRTGYLLDTYPNLKFDNETQTNFDRIWQWIGSYETWKSAMQVFLFPENILLPTLKSKQSSHFSKLVEKLPSQMTPEAACRAGRNYADYFQDICNLEVQASCQVSTPVTRKEGCNPISVSSESRVHLFALATNSGRVYTSSFHGRLDGKDTQDSWRVVPEADNVLQIIGAVPHETPNQQRLILLFVKIRHESRNRLMMFPFNLDKQSWISPTELDLPPGAETDFTAVALQKRPSSEITAALSQPAPSNATSKPKLTYVILAIRVPNGRIFIRNLNGSATDWAGSGWMPLFGNVLAEEIAKVCALLQRSDNEYMMIVHRHDGWLVYRIFSSEPVTSKDDGFWRRIARGEFAGAFTWPTMSKPADVFVSYRANNQTRYAVVRRSVELRPQGIPLSSVNQIDEWLRSTVGVSLSNFKLKFTTTFQLTKTVIQEGFGIQIPLGEIGYWDDFNGNLLNLLMLTPKTWSYNPPEEANEKKDELLGLHQETGLNIFISEVQQLDQVDYEHRPLGQWKLADHYIKAFANGKGLIETVTDAFYKKATTFRLRDVNENVNAEDENIEVKLQGTVAFDFLYFIPSGGDEEKVPNPQKAIAFGASNGFYRMKLRRSGNVLSAPRKQRITPRGLGPFDITPQISAADLQTRKALIEDTYQLNGNAPPSVLVYLHEAYRDVPLHLALQLQRSGYYQEALDWFRLVYDYTQKVEKRKIAYSLVAEEKLEFNFDRAEDWLDDATNPHAIAVTRSNTYTRFTLLSIIRCLLDYADGEFTYDTAESLARARILYNQALELLDSPELNRFLGLCDEFIKKLNIDVVEGRPTNWSNSVQATLAQMRQPAARLQTIVATLNETASNSDLTTGQKIQQMQTIVNEAASTRPPVKVLAKVIEDRATHLEEFENRLLPHLPASRSLTGVVQRQGRQFLANVSEIAGISEAELEDGTVELPWLRATVADDANPDNGNGRSPFGRLSALNPLNPQRTATLKQITAAMPQQSLAGASLNRFSLSGALSFNFCVPSNPVLKALRLRATLNLYKLQNCLNIAGMRREVEPYAAPIGIESGLPLIGASGNLSLPGLPRIQPTPYRYAFLIDRAKELVNLAQQMEAAFLSALVNVEQEAFARLQARQGITLAQAKEKLQQLRIGEARSQVGLANLQRSSAQLRANTYSQWIAAGQNQFERNMLQAYEDAGQAQERAARARTVGQVASAGLSAIPESWSEATWVPGVVMRNLLSTVVASSAIAEGAYNVQAIQAETSAQTNSALASFERRNQEWGLQQGLAAIDVSMGNQQIQIAQAQLRVVGQEHAISQIEVEHATDVLLFLQTKFLNEELYRWMSDVLESVYRYFLQQATAVAKLAENQLAFERQEASATYIQADYWDTPGRGNSFSNPGEAIVDRRGLTGSARLLQDLYQLDQYAFETNKRKLQLSKTFDLAQLFPFEFQQFRETGVLVFPTSMEWFDRDFPGHYLRLIAQVRVSVVALVPPTEGIKATLTSSGISRVVIRGDRVQTVPIRREPEQVALTSPMNATGVFELDLQSELLRPFEGSGVDTQWEFRLPKATNRFDFNSIATVLITIDYTSLNSYTYQQQVLQTLDRKVNSDRLFSFRNTFADAWYDLNNPDQTTTPMVVQFETRREDFPPNIENLRIQHVVLYFARIDRADVEIPVTRLLFTDQHGTGTVGGRATTIDGTTISTRRGNGISWTPMIGMSPFGTWELALETELADGQLPRALFETEAIENILLVITYTGQVPNYPA
ncbi:MAG TPA: neuraminidase-like domain-containing protein [Leptolyngbyaceae cyanobacterium]